MLVILPPTLESNMVNKAHTKAVILDATAIEINIFLRNTPMDSKNFKEYLKLDNPSIKIHIKTMESMLPTTVSTDIKCFTITEIRILNITTRKHIIVCDINVCNKNLDELLILIIFNSYCVNWSIE